jgi:uncharacterized membrane protein
MKTPTLLSFFRTYEVQLGCLFFFTVHIILKSLHINANPIALDEPFSIFHAQMNIEQIIQKLLEGNNPPLYELILHYWIHFFGTDSTAVRWPSMLFGASLVAAMFALCKVHFNQRIAWLCASLLTLSNVLLYFSHEARGYSLFALLTVLSFHCVLLVLSTKERRLYWIALFFVYSCLIYTHYFGLAVIGLHAVYFFLFAPSSGDKRKKYLLLISAVFIAYSPILPTLVRRFTESAQQGTWLAPVENVGQLMDLILLFCNSNKWIYLLVLIVFFTSVGKLVIGQFSLSNKIKIAFLLSLFLALLVCISIFFPLPFFWKLTSSSSFTYLLCLFFLTLQSTYLFTKGKADGQRLASSWFIYPVVLFFCVSFVMPIFLDRYLFFTLPAFVLLLSMGIDYLATDKKYFLLLSFVIGILFLSTSKGYESNKRNPELIARSLAQRCTAQTNIILCPPSYNLTLAYHYLPHAFLQWSAFDSLLTASNVYPMYNAITIDHSFQRCNHVVYVDAHAAFTLPNNGILDELKNNYELVDTVIFPDSMRMYEFVKKDRIPIATETLPYGGSAQTEVPPMGNPLSSGRLNLAYAVHPRTMKMGKS